MKFTGTITIRKIERKIVTIRTVSRPTDASSEVPNETVPPLDSAGPVLVKPKEEKGK
jgi:hypothetical protein